MSSVASGMTTASSDDGRFSFSWKCSVYLSSSSVSFVSNFPSLSFIMTPPPARPCSLWIHYTLVRWSCILSLALPVLTPPLPQSQVGPWLLFYLDGKLLDFLVGIGFHSCILGNRRELVYSIFFLVVLLSSIALKVWFNVVFQILCVLYEIQGLLLVQNLLYWCQFVKILY